MKKSQAYPDFDSHTKNVIPNLALFSRIYEYYFISSLPLNIIRLSSTEIFFSGIYVF